MCVDFEFMKCYGVNVICILYYLLNVCFFDLCDEYGVWVFFECDFEIYGFERGGWDGNLINDDCWYDCLFNCI